MVNLTREGLKEPEWKEISVRLPQFNLIEMVRRTKEAPVWVHIAPSNLFIGEIAPIQQALLESGIVQEGIIGLETWDEEIVDRIYRPHDNLRLRIVMPPGRANQPEVIASTAETVFADTSRPEEWEKSREYFAKPSLQMVTITCTEKGYSIRDPNDRLAETISKDIQNGPSKPGHIMAKLASLLNHRHQNGAGPIALVSMDNCSENGKRLFEAVSFIAQEWVSRKLVEKEFLEYLESKKVSFPWTMIDRITPSPAKENKEWLEERGIQNMEILRTVRGTFAAPFVNTEHISYLVIEENFPNGRPPLEKVDTSGNRIIFVESSGIVDKCEKMK
ncbi:MAG: mannitol dehydrogenase family protein, partial [Candidatus Omnitrophica bacterium]|nr:mannitol dehydrogenase family protein [Candidatus Omnitrophota bacterium]